MRPVALRGCCTNTMFVYGSFTIVFAPPIGLLRNCKLIVGALGQFQLADYMEKNTKYGNRVDVDTNVVPLVDPNYPLPIRLERQFISA